MKDERHCVVTQIRQEEGTFCFTVRVNVDVKRPTAVMFGLGYRDSAVIISVKRTCGQTHRAA